MRNVRKVWRVCEAIHTAYHMAVLSSVTLEVDLMEKKCFYILSNTGGVSCVYRQFWTHILIQFNAKEVLNFIFYSMSAFTAAFGSWLTIPSWMPCNDCRPPSNLEIFCISTRSFDTRTEWRNDVGLMQNFVRLLWEISWNIIITAVYNSLSENYSSVYVCTFFTHGLYMRVWYCGPMW